MNLKLNYGKKVVCVGDVGQMIYQNIDLKHAPVNNTEEWVFGLAFKTMHQGVNKCISNTSSIEFYENAVGAIKDYCQMLKSDVDILAPPRVRLNLHSINNVHNAI